MNPESIARFGVDSGIHAFMNTQWGWPAVESLHFIGLSLLLGTVGLFDLRLLGLARSIPVRALHALVPWGVAGFLLNVCTGLLFFVSDPGQYLYNPAFQLKMLAMLVAGINLGLFYLFLARRVRGDSPPAASQPDIPPAARMVALVSLGCWLAVISFGRLITFYRPPEHWCFWCN